MYYFNVKTPDFQLNTEIKEFNNFIESEMLKKIVTLELRKIENVKDKKSFVMQVIFLDVVTNFCYALLYALFDLNKHIKYRR